MSDELGFSYTQLNNSYGISAATLSIGCVLFVPFALRYGRRPIYILTSILMFITDIWAAKQRTVGDLYGTNVILGLAGSVNETLYQMTVSQYLHHAMGLFLSNPC
jgi:MFS family permease